MYESSSRHLTTTPGLALTLDEHIMSAAFTLYTVCARLFMFTLLLVSVIGILVVVKYSLHVRWVGVAGSNPGKV